MKFQIKNESYIRLFVSSLLVKYGASIEGESAVSFNQRKKKLLRIRLEFQCTSCRQPGHDTDALVDFVELFPFDPESVLLEEMCKLAG
jgi:hypothetical protein